MQDAGSALMGIGTASGESRASEAAKAAISSPLLEESVEGATGILLNITGGNDLGLFEVNEAAELIHSAADAQSNIIFGAVIDPGDGRRHPRHGDRHGLRPRPRAAALAPARRPAPAAATATSAWTSASARRSRSPTTISTSRRSCAEPRRSRRSARPRAAPITRAWSASRPLSSRWHARRLRRVRRLARPLRAARVVAPGPRRRPADVALRPRRRAAGRLGAVPRARAAAPAASGSPGC